MARSKVRFTGFTRFLFVMIIVVPLAYLGAAYYNGEDGIGNIKRLLGIGDPVEQVDRPETNTEQSEPRTIPTQEESAPVEEQELEYYKRRVQELETENIRLQERIWEAEQKLSEAGNN